MESEDHRIRGGDKLGFKLSNTPLYNCESAKSWDLNLDDAYFVACFATLENEETKPICTGTILTERHVITAAHCFWGHPPPGKNYFIEALRVSHFLSNEYFPIHLLVRFMLVAYTWMPKDHFQLKALL